MIFVCKNCTVKNFSCVFTVVSRVDESHIRNTLENFRRRMCYHDPNGLPQLEPLALKEEVPLEVNNDIGK